METNTKMKVGLVGALVVAAGIGGAIGGWKANEWYSRRRPIEVRSTDNRGQEIDKNKDGIKDLLLIQGGNRFAAGRATYLYGRSDGSYVDPRTFVKSLATEYMDDK